MKHFFQCEKCTIKLEMLLNIFTLHAVNFNIVV